MEEDLKIPFVSQEVIEYLKETFNIEYLLEFKMKNNDEHLGFIRGVREVIGRLEVIHDTQYEQED